MKTITMDFETYQDEIYQKGRDQYQQGQEGLLLDLLELLKTELTNKDVYDIMQWDETVGDWPRMKNLVEKLRKLKHGK